MAYTTVLMEIQEHIAVITLNRPPMNSINLGMREDLDTALTELEKDESIRVVIITGAGDKGFCAGMDVGDVGNLYNGPDAIELFNRIDRLPEAGDCGAERLHPRRRVRAGPGLPLSLHG